MITRVTSPNRDARRAALALALSVTSVLALTACASSTYQMSNAYGVGSANGVATTRATMPVPRKPVAPKLEDDGFPVQTAPFRRFSREPDDPSEPFSPNYGTLPLGNEKPSYGYSQDAAIDEDPTDEVDVDADVDVDVADTADDEAEPNAGGPRSVSWRPLTDREADAVIARAIIAHEQRNP